MKNYCWLSFLFSLGLFAYPNTAISQEIIPKREFRGAWIASVANIDFPSKPAMSQASIASEWTGMLDFLQETGFNAILVQVRPAADAFYESRVSPWSKYLTGKQGTAPENGFDPMRFMIGEAHKRNLEFHAWLNPYRASMDTLVNNLSENHPYFRHPEWFVKYGGKLYFNPALPEVRNYITEVVMEILMKYDVDGIHFDDYFYPYPAAGELYPDAADFEKYGYGFFSIGEWRRANVDMLISQISEMKKVVAPHVKFGVSPFGVWRNLAADPQFGSATTASVSTYDDLFADVRYWLEKGWIDYVAPQLYWNIGFPPANYEILADWWQKNSFERNVYIGQAAYKVGQNQQPAWQSPNEIPKQIQLNRMIPRINGSIFYNTNSLQKNLLGMTDSLRNHYYSKPAIWPEVKSLGLPSTAAPKLGKPKLKKGVIEITCEWKDPGNLPAYLVLYRFEDRLPGDYDNPMNIHSIIRLEEGSKYKIRDQAFENGKTYTYAVSSLNRQYTESPLSEWHAVEIRGKRLKRIK